MLMKKRVTANGPQQMLNYKKNLEQTEQVEVEKPSSAMVKSEENRPETLEEAELMMADIIEDVHPESETDIEAITKSYHGKDKEIIRKIYPFFRAGLEFPSTKQKAFALQWYVTCEDVMVAVGVVDDTKNTRTYAWRLLQAYARQFDAELKASTAECRYYGVRLTTLGRDYVDLARAEKQPPPPAKAKSKPPSPLDRLKKQVDAELDEEGAAVVDSKGCPMYTIFLYKDRDPSAPSHLIVRVSIPIDASSGECNVSSKTISASLTSAERLRIVFSEKVFLKYDLDPEDDAVVATLSINPTVDVEVRVNFFWLLSAVLARFSQNRLFHHRLLLSSR